MKELNQYILEKLKINKNSKPSSIDNLSDGLEKLFNGNIYPVKKYSDNILKIFRLWKKDTNVSNYNVYVYLQSKNDDFIFYIENLIQHIVQQITYKKFDELTKTLELPINPTVELDEDNKIYYSEKAFHLDHFYYDLIIEKIDKVTEKLHINQNTNNVFEIIMNIFDIKNNNLENKVKEWIKNKDVKKLMIYVKSDKDADIIKNIYDSSKVAVLNNDTYYSFVDHIHENGMLLFDTDKFSLKKTNDILYFNSTRYTSPIIICRLVNEINNTIHN